MKQKEQVPDIGFSSITSVLRNIHDEQINASVVLGEVSENIEILTSSSVLSLSNILNNQITFNSKHKQLLDSINLGILTINATLNALLEQFGAEKKIGKDDFKPQVTQVITSDDDNKRTSLDINPVVNILTDIKTLLRDFFENKTNKQSAQIDIDTDAANKNINEKLGNMFSNAVNSSVLSDDMIQILDDTRLNLMNTNMILSDMLDYIRDIYFLIPDISNGGSAKTVTQSVKTRNEEFNKLLESFTELQSKLNDKFIKNFDKFVKYYMTFIDEKNSKKLRLVSTNLNLFAAALKSTSILMKGVKKTFSSLTTSIIFLTLSLVNPLFTVALGVLYGAMKGLRKTFGDIKTAVLLPNTMRSIGLAVAVLIGGLFLVQHLSFATLGKFLLFMTGMLGVFKLFGGGGEAPALSDAFAGKKTVFKNKSSIDGIFSAAVGIAILVLALNSANNIDYTRASMLLVFLGGLSITMGMMNRGKFMHADSKGNAFFKLSLGLAILVLAVAAVGEINWAGALAMIAGFVIGIGIVMLIANKFMGAGSGFGKGGGINMMFNGNVSMKGMFGFALGLAILLLVVDAIHEVNWKDTIILLTFIAAVGLAVALPGLISRGKINGQPNGGMLGFAFGIAIILLTVDACSEVNWDNAWKLLLFIGGLVFEFKILTSGLKSGKTLLAATGALVIATAGIIGCLKLLDYITVDYDKLAFFGLASLEFISISTIIGYLSEEIYSGAKALAVLVGGMFAISGLIWWILGYVTIDIVKLGLFALGTAIIIGLSVIASKFKEKIEEGAVSLLIVSGVGIVLAFAFQQIAEVNLDFLSFIEFVGAATILTLAMAAASFVAPFAAVGALGVACVAVASIVTALALIAIQNLNVQEDKIKTFGNTINVLIDAFNEIGIIAAGKAVIKAGMLAIIAGTSIVTCGALTLISLLNIKEDKIKSFGKSSVSLIDAFNEIGIITAGKAVIKAGMLVVVAGASVLIALAFRVISALEIKPNALDNFGILMNQFLDAVVEPINKAADKLKAIEPALSSLMKLVSISKGLLDVVESYANMKVGVWTYNRNTGKMELTGYKKIDTKIFGEVGKNIGTLLQALLEPLTIIASDDETWNFNGVIVKNPFKGGWFGMDNNSGANRIQRIGNAFGSLITTMNGLSYNRFLSGYWKEYLRFKGILMNFVGSVIQIINKFSNVNTDNFGDHGKHVQEFFDYIGKISTTNGESLHVQVDKLMNSLSDKAKWNILNNQLNRTRKNIDAIVKTINKISMTKATMLQKNLQILSNARTAEQIKRAIAELERLISTIVEYQDRQEKSNAQMVDTMSQAFGIDKKEDAEKNGVIYDKNGNVDRSKTDIKALLTSILYILQNQTSDGKPDMDVYITNVDQIATTIAKELK